jgi:uncharacterized protein involved in tellurium resistance
VIHTDPRTAGARPDLDFLRHRSRRAAAPAIPVDTAPPPAAPRTVRAVASHQPRRAGAGPATILATKPTLTLTRLQSGVGVLTIEAACAPTVGDLRLGCAYQLRSGVSSMVQAVSGVTSAPPGSARPVIVGARGRFETLTIDLVQSRDIERLLVYAFSESDSVLSWGGTLVLTAFGPTRIEIPLDRPPSPNILMALSIYNIRGEFVVRAELEELVGPVRAAVSAYGFDRISWLDQRTPLT